MKNTYSYALLAITALTLATAGCEKAGENVTKNEALPVLSKTSKGNFATQENEAIHYLANRVGGSLYCFQAKKVWPFYSIKFRSTTLA